MIVCNPHNPGGVVWAREELEAVAEICAEDNILVFSDEIHADLTLPPARHLPFAMVSEKARNNSVTFMAPSKTFNMPGVAASHSIIYNKDIRSRFNAWLEAGELNAGHVFAWPAVEAAYTYGAEWLEQCLEYIQGNIDYVDNYLKNRIPRNSCHASDGFLSGLAGLSGTEPVAAGTESSFCRRGRAGSQ